MQKWGLRRSSVLPAGSGFWWFGVRAKIVARLGQGLRLGGAETPATRRKSGTDPERTRVRPGAVRSRAGWDGEEQLPRAARSWQAQLGLSGLVLLRRLRPPFRRAAAL